MIKYRYIIILNKDICYTFNLFRQINKINFLVMFFYCQHDDVKECLFRIGDEKKKFARHNYFS